MRQRSLAELKTLTKLAPVSVQPRVLLAFKSLQTPRYLALEDAVDAMMVHLIDAGLRDWTTQQLNTISQ